MKIPKADARGRHIRRALYDLRNLAALGKCHTNLSSLVLDILSRKVGKLRNPLDDRHDEITDPAGYPEVIALANRLRTVRNAGGAVWVPHIGGVDIALKAILAGIGITRVERGGDAVTEGAESDWSPPTCCTTTDFALGVFKAAHVPGNR